MANVLQDLITIVNKANTDMKRDLEKLSKFKDFYPTFTVGGSQAQYYESIISEATLAIYADLINHYLITEKSNVKLKTFFKNFLKERIKAEAVNRKKANHAVQMYRAGK